MSDSTQDAETTRVPPGEGGWLDAKRAVAERNEQARQSHKKDRADMDRAQIARQRAQREDRMN